MLSNPTFDIDVALAPARRALGIAACTRLMMRGLVGGACAGVVILVAGYVWSLPRALAVALAMLLVGPLAGAVVAIVRWPGTVEAARAADRCFVLGDRLTTALEFRNSQEPLVVCQRADAARSVRGLPLHRVGRGKAHWRERGAAMAALAVLAGLAVNGPSHTSVAAGGNESSVNQRIQHASVVALPAISRELERSLARSDRHDRSIALLRAALSRLQNQLQHSRSLSQALRAISLTQQQLHQLDTALHPLSSMAVAQLNLSLGRYLSPGGASGARNVQDAGKTARALARLAASLQHLQAAQRQALARALARTANSTPDSRLRTALRQAASALNRKDTTSAAIFLKHGVTLLNEASHGRRARARIRASTSRLDKLKNSISSVRRKLSLRPTPGTAGGKSGKAGQKRSGNNSQNRGRKKPTSSRSLTRTWKPTNESTAAKDQRVIANVRRAGQGGRVNNDIQSSTQKHRKARTTVFLRGHEGQGARLLQNGPRGAPSQAMQAQYRQLVIQYARTARTALDRGALPPSVQVYVRQYFSEISR